MCVCVCVQVQDFTDKVNFYVMNSVTFFKSMWPEVRRNASLFVGESLCCREGRRREGEGGKKGRSGRGRREEREKWKGKEGRRREGEVGRREKGRRGSGKGKEGRKGEGGGGTVKLSHSVAWGRAQKILILPRLEKSSVFSHQWLTIIVIVSFPSHISVAWE